MGNNGWLPIQSCAGSRGRINPDDGDSPSLKTSTLDVATGVASSSRPIMKVVARDKLAVGQTSRVDSGAWNKWQTREDSSPSRQISGRRYEAYLRSGISLSCVECELAEVSPGSASQITNERSEQPTSPSARQTGRQAARRAVGIRLSSSVALNAEWASSRCSLEFQGDAG